MNRKNRGIVLVVVLAIIAGLTIALAIFADSQQGHFQSTVNRNELRRARVAAMAGVQRAMAELVAVAEAPQDPVTLEDDWATLFTGAEEFQISNESFRLQIVDNTSFLDLNAVTEDQLNNLGLTQEQVDSLLDWREAGNATRAQGAKDEYYNGLPKRYNAHLNRFQSAYELLDVRGFAPVDVFQVNPDTFVSGNATRPEIPLIDIFSVNCFASAFNPDGDGKANINNPTLQAQQLAQQAQVSQGLGQQIIFNRTNQPNGAYARLSQVIALAQGNQNDIRGILDRMTVSPTERIEGFVNINTAPQEILQLVPGITEDLAQQIVDQRPTDGYRQLSELLTISSDQAFVNAIADSLATSSQSFQVRVEGRAGRMKVSLVAFVTLNEGVPTILRIEETPYADMPTRWNWPETSTVETLLETQ